MSSSTPGNRGRLLVIDDDVDIRRTVSDRLEAEGYEVGVAAGGVAGLECIRGENPEVVLLDLQMPEMDGIAVLDQLRSEQLSATVVVITAYGSIERAVEAMRAGAFDFVSKPIDPGRISVVVEKAMEHERLRRANAYWRAEAEAGVPKLAGDSARMKEALSGARRAADGKTTVLLTGESGTGKGMLARNIHHWSPRRHLPFVTVNCVALTEQLLESELFGHEKGAFTGADRQRKGRFEVAQGGTIFLDEIGSTKPSLQLKLLQVYRRGPSSASGGRLR